METVPPVAELDFDYAVDRTLLTPALRDSFFESAVDGVVAAFIQRAEAQRAGALRTFAFRGLQRVLSDYDAYGALGMYRMHLLSTAQWCALLDRRPDAKHGALLDVGAGDGAVTEFARALFESIAVTEHARALQRVLKRKGFDVVGHDLGTSPWPDARRFDVISLLNVLDRTRFPRTLLKNACNALAPHGTLLISLPLPLRPHVHVGPHTVDPEEPLPLTEDSWERGACALVRELFEPTGLRVQRWTRVPYLSHGDSERSFYVLDAAVFACSSP